MMATSSRAMFKLETLKQEALAALDLKIEQSQHYLASFQDADVFAERIKLWREHQEEKIQRLVDQLAAGEVDNYRLSRFALDPIPEQDDLFDRRRTERRIDHLAEQRAEVEAKANSLASDQDGNISLTKTQLREFFGL